MASGSELTLGMTSVSYTAKGKSGQLAYCRFNMTLNYQGFSCLDTPSTAHGKLDCREENYLYHCHIQCDDGYINNNPYNGSHKCQTGGWAPPFPPDVDVMACLQETPKAVRTTLDLKFTGKCQGTHGFRESFVAQVVTQLHLRTDVCDINSVGLCQPRNFDLLCGQSVSRVVRAISEITLRLTAWLPPKQAESTELLGKLRNLTESGQLEVLVGDNLFTATGLHYTSNNNTGCPQGWMPYIDRCLLCPAGARLDVATQTCVSCRSGQYQSAEGQLSCFSCPSGRTSEVGAFTEAQCVIVPVENETPKGRVAGRWSMILIILLCVVGGIVVVVTFVLACLVPGRRVFRHKHTGKLTLPDAEKNGTMSLPSHGPLPQPCVLGGTPAVKSQLSMERSDNMQFSRVDGDQAGGKGRFRLVWVGGWIAYTSTTSAKNQVE
ncbi:hypothetical protein LSAT2_028204 [Lamellibrachia satsuma]|nr:hypothetical protein LSAT2_028204 [Lamellibrachia satsuma]